MPVLSEDVLSQARALQFVKVRGFETLDEVSLTRTEPQYALGEL